MKCPKCGKIINNDNATFCPVCGNILNKNTHPQKNIKSFSICPNCGKQYLYEMNHCNECGYKTEDYTKEMQDLEEAIYSEKTNPSKPQQHCPVCNSTNIQKISVASKAVGAGLFGIFSKTARSQFECKDCGYKF